MRLGSTWLANAPPQRFSPLARAAKLPLPQDAPCADITSKSTCTLPQGKDQHLNVTSPLQFADLTLAAAAVSERGASQRTMRVAVCPGWILPFAYYPNEQAHSRNSLCKDFRLAANRSGTPSPSTVHL